MNSEQLANGLRLRDIKVIFLDIGGVLLTNGWGRVSRQSAAEEFGVDFSVMDKRHELIFNIYEEGRVSLDVYMDTILFYEPRPFTKEAFRTFMFQQSKLLPNMLDWLIAWKAQQPQLRFFSLNNEPRELHQHRVDHFELRRLYDGFVCSCDLGLRKPDPQIFAVALGVAGVQPHECLYIDDREVMVTAGKMAGLNVWHHQNSEATISFLQSL
ncbi:HAD-IA family hydrolase [Flavisolibacter tropicus]|uniref:Hydrolase n=1 Tax=Flavisolibacter tropicus TaxID=1492898 RepID=A0A172TUM4_9BACT|nr:HAD-IA family hydrolase [Flavisolibacter tropicus]ANE50821.1 hypothetical protein SY85_10200 [Flavisolibacter tropicus]